MLAIHPRTGELKTGSILTSDGHVFHTQFDKTDLGVMKLHDNMIFPITNSNERNGGEKGEDTGNMTLNSLRNIYLKSKLSNLLGVSAEDVTN